MAENKIRDLRRSRGLSQAELAKIVGVAQNTLSYWENGKYDIDNKSLSIMADYFGVSVDYILGREISISNMNRIAALRAEKGIRQIELAQTLGVSQGTLSTWENGKYEPDISTLKRLSDYFNVPIDYILGRKQDIQFATYGDAELDGDALDEIAAFAAYARAQKNKASSKDEADRLELADLYDRLSPENKKLLLAAAKGLAGDR